MTNQILIISVFITLLSLQLILNRLKTPIANYVKIAVAAMLLVLIWFFGGDSSMGPRLILSGLALTSIIKEYLSLQKLAK